MVDAELLKYIHEQQEKGVHMNEILGALLAKGYTDEQIDEAFNIVGEAEISKAHMPHHDPTTEPSAPEVPATPVTQPAIAEDLTKDSNAPVDEKVQLPHEAEPEHSVNTGGPQINADVHPTESAVPDPITSPKSHKKLLITIGISAAALIIIGVVAYWLIIVLK